MQNLLKPIQIVEKIFPSSCSLFSFLVNELLIDPNKIFEGSKSTCLKSTIDFLLFLKTSKVVVNYKDLSRDYTDKRLDNFILEIKNGLNLPSNDEIITNPTIKEVLLRIVAQLTKAHFQEVNSFNSNSSLFQQNILTLGYRIITERSTSSLENHFEIECFSTNSLHSYILNENFQKLLDIIGEFNLKKIFILPFFIKHEKKNFYIQISGPPAHDLIFSLKLSENERIRRNKEFTLNSKYLIKNNINILPSIMYTNLSTYKSILALLNEKERIYYKDLNYSIKINFFFPRYLYFKNLDVNDGQYTSNSSMHHLNPNSLSSNISICCNDKLTNRLPLPKLLLCPSRNSILYNFKPFYSYHHLPRNHSWLHVSYFISY